MGVVGTLPQELADRGVTGREAEILWAVAERLSNREIAERLVISIRTVESHVSSLLQKLCLPDRRALARHAATLRWKRDRTRLRDSLTSFVGRERELGELRGLLTTRPFVTLIGPGGVGKSRLCLEAVRRHGEALPADVLFVELAPMTEPDLLPRAVAGAAGVTNHVGQPPEDVLASALSHRDVLLVMDNCEHLLDAAAALVHRLLGDCPRLVVAATSRAPLGVPGEVTYPVDPLPLSVNGTSESAALADAVQLFVDRAQAADPRFRMSPQLVPVVTSICERLDGLPLAIELAASRVRALSPRQIADHLHDRFALLASGPRTVLPRQRTLKATLDWSFDLLTSDERIVFARMAVFAGGCTLEACERVCAGDRIGQSDVAGLLGSLVDKSLVVARRGDEAMRYDLLETIREYARHRLVDSGENDPVRRRHAAFFLELFEEALSEERGSNDLSWAARLRAEQDNLRAALDWALTVDKPELALRLATGGFVLWGSQGSAVEGRGWLQRALDAAPDTTPDLRARALCAAAWLEAHQGDFHAAAGLAEQGLDAARRGRDRQAEAWALMTLGALLPSPEMLDQSRSLFRDLGDSYYLSKATFLRGYCASVTGRHEEAEDHLRAGLEMHDARGDAWDAAFARWNLSSLAVTRGDLERAATLLEHAVDTFRRLGDMRGVSGALQGRAVVHRLSGELSDAEELAQESLRLARDVWDQRTVVRALVTLGGLTRLAGELSLAAALLAAAERLRENTGHPMNPLDEQLLQQDVEALREELPTDEFQGIWEHGRRLAPRDAVALALATVEAAGTGSGDDHPTARAGRRT